MDITVSPDVRGQMLSVECLVAGKQESFSLAKSYRHKHGEEVDVLVNWWAYPRDSGEVECFIVEALPSTCTKDELERCRKEIFGAISALKNEMDKRMDAEEKARRHRQEVVSRSHDQKTKISIGSGGQVPIALVIAAFAIGALLLGYVVYLLTWNMHGGHADPPKIPIPANSVIDE